MINARALPRPCGQMNDTRIPSLIFQTQNRALGLKKAFSFFLEF